LVRIFKGETLKWDFKGQSPLTDKKIRAKELELFLEFRIVFRVL
jgi:hypothetical protein